MHEKKMIVVGAGAAGLAAALRLVRAGFDVTVLEARNRIGGRAWTVDMPGCELPVEIGPEWVHGHPEVSLRLLARYGIERIPNASQSWAMNHGVGTLEDDDDDEQLAALMQRAAHELPPGGDASLVAALNAVALPTEATLVARACAAARGFDAADPSDASFRAVHEEWQGDASLQTTSARLDGGYRRLWYGIARELDERGVHMTLGATVTRIAYGAHGVDVAVKDAGDIAAATCVVTVPLGVLQRSAEENTIAFVPPLPAERSAALTRLAMGPVIKVHAVFARPFWKMINDGRFRDASFFRAPADSVFPVMWTTAPRESSLLTAWAGGSDVRGPLLGGEQQILEAFFASLAAVFGAETAAQARDHCRHHAVWNWPREPYTYGAYSYARVGGLEARRLLAHPLGDRIYFAGEAYAQRGEAGTVAGALETGEAAAAAIIAASSSQSLH